MARKIELPTVSPEELSPLIIQLLGIIETLIEENRQQSETQQQLRDEIAVLKGEKPKPKFKPSKLDQSTDDQDNDEKKDGDGRRAGSNKRKKTEKLKIHHESVIQPKEPVPAGSTFKGYRNYVVQDLKIESCNTRYKLAIWMTPEGKILCGKAPQSGHFGDPLKSYILYQHHHCHVTQPLLLEQLREWGVDISSGQIERILTEQEEAFTEEKDALLSAGLEGSGYITVDDSGARHQGKNGYVTHIGNRHFAWFKSTGSKSRINFLKCLRAGESDYRVTEEAVLYMTQEKLAKKSLAKLQDHPLKLLVDELHLEEHLDTLGIKTPRHRRIATESALIGSLLEHSLRHDLVIVSDDAGQFNVLMHALCWVHTERLVHKLIPLNEQHRIDIQQVRDQIWTLYRDLKSYQKSPSETQKSELGSRFDAIFSQKTSYETLNQALKRIRHNRSELLLVLERPDIPLHTNGSETDIRDFVKKRKISGGTRSDKGRRCRDTFASLKKTCRKLGISFWDFLKDRTTGAHLILPLPELVRQSIRDEAATLSY
jgi:hypothetical protein